MARLCMLALLLVGCAHQASPQPREYLYGKVDRPYTAVPKYLEQQPQAEPPAQVCDQCPPDTRTRL